MIFVCFFIYIHSQLLVSALSNCPCPTNELEEEKTNSSKSSVFLICGNSNNISVLILTLSEVECSLVGQIFLSLLFVNSNLFSHPQKYLFPNMNVVRFAGWSNHGLTYSHHWIISFASLLKNIHKCQKDGNSVTILCKLIPLVKEGFFWLYSGKSSWQKA